MAALLAGAIGLLSWTVALLTGRLATLLVLASLAALPLSLVTLTLLAALATLLLLPLLSFVHGNLRL